jgi:hypothetical protein
MEGWHRVHQPLGRATTIAFLAGLALAAVFALIWISLIGGSTTAFAAAMYSALGAIILAVWAMGTWAQGVYVGDTGVKITYGLTTLLFAWPEIAGFERRADTLWILTSWGTAVETPVIRGRFRLGRMPAGKLYFADPLFDAVVAELADQFRLRTRPAA